MSFYFSDAKKIRKMKNKPIIQIERHIHNCSVFIYKKIWVIVIGDDFNLEKTLRTRLLPQDGSKISKSFSLKVFILFETLFLTFVTFHSYILSDTDFISNDFHFLRVHVGLCYVSTLYIEVKFGYQEMSCSMHWTFCQCIYP